jgi:hypothetical protein
MDDEPEDLEMGQDSAVGSDSDSDEEELTRRLPPVESYIARDTGSLLAAPSRDTISVDDLGKWSIGHIIFYAR